MGRDSGKCLHQLDVLWVCGQPTHTSGGGGCGSTAVVINILKIRKLRSVGGGRSTIAVEGDRCLGNRCWKDRCLGTIAVEAITVEMIAVWGNCLMCWSWGGSIDNCCWDNCCWGRSLLRQSLLRQFAVEAITVEAIASCADPGGGQSMIAVEAITVEGDHWDDHCWGNHLMCWSLGGSIDDCCWVMITVEMIAVEDVRHCWGNCCWVRLLLRRSVIAV